MRRFGIVGILLVGSCQYGGPVCMTTMKKLCNTCPTNDYNDAVCACIDDGKLTRDEVAEGYAQLLGIDDDEDAQKVCDLWTYDLRYPGDNSAAQCKQSLEYLRDWDVEACNDLGWTGD